MLRLLREARDEVEADLQIHCGVDLRDRWRKDEHGRPLLTLRRLWVLVRSLPPDSATMRHLDDGKPHWSIEAHLLDDLRMSWTGTEKKPATPHPDRPIAKRPRASASKRADAQRRARRRRQRVASGEIT